MAEIRKLYREHICRLCNTTIGDTGMCSYQCDNDFVLVRDRPQGTVIERTYQMNLIEEREN